MTIASHNMEHDGNRQRIVHKKAKTMIEYVASDGRATITINDPERRNPISVGVMTGLLEATNDALADPEVRVLVYTGAGDKAFSAGGDLSGEFVNDPIGLHKARGVLADLFRTMYRGGKPTVARVNGHALAGGFGLAVACDITVCVADAKLGMTEIRVGLWPMMISAVLVRSMPKKAALDLMEKFRSSEVLLGAQTNSSELH